MNRAYLATLTITLLASTSAYAAINCATPPTCAELGYTDTVASCSDSIKCPFDTTKGKCIGSSATVGQIGYFPYDVTDSKWVKCDGRYLHKNAYPDLFAVLSTRFGGSGNTFRVPDYAGDFVRVYGTNSGSLTQRQKESLPNITGTWVASAENQSYVAPTGAFYEGSKTGDGVDGDEGWFITMKFDASRSSSIYGASSHVTPVNTAVNAYIYAGKVDTSKGSARDLIAGCTTNSYYYTDGTCSSSLNTSKTLKGIVNSAGSNTIFYYSGGGSSAKSYVEAEAECKKNGANGGVLGVSAAKSYIKITSVTGRVYPISTSKTYWEGSGNVYKCSSTTSCSSAGSPTIGTYYYYYCMNTDYFY